MMEWADFKMETMRTPAGKLCLKAVATSRGGVEYSHAVHLSGDDLSGIPIALRAIAQWFEAPWK